MSKITVAALLAALAGCAQPESPPERGQLPLIGGTVDDGDLAVVALTHGGADSFCTGTLVSPSVIVTAAHCLDLAGADEIISFFGSDTTSEGVRIGTRKTQHHPMWTGSVNGSGPHYDVGLILLNFPQDPALPIPLNREAASDHLGEPYRQVGFGIFQRDPATADGKKRTGVTSIYNSTGDVVESGDDQVSICFGDSGGPGLLTFDDVEYIAGIHSYTYGSLDQPPDQRCTPPNGDTRVDLYADNFIQDWIEANDPVCGADGTCGYKGCLDDPDCQPCGPDGECTTGCDLPDPDCATSDLGDICQADTQCKEGQCVFWQGDPSTKFCTVPCQPGDSCPDGMSCQDRGVLGMLCYYDAAPAGVVGDSCSQPTDCGSYICDNGTCVTPCDLSLGMGCPVGFECSSTDQTNYYCRQPAEQGGGGGCALGGGAGPGGGSWAGALLALAALLGLAYRPRRASAARPRSSR